MAAAAAATAAQAAQRSTTMAGESSSASIAFHLPLHLHLLLLLLPMSAAVSRTPDARNARLTVTTEAGRQWAEQRLPVGPRQVPTSVTLEVNPGTQFQTVMGFGGAITQAAAMQFKRLSHTKRRRAMDMLFGPHGLRYNMARIPIGSCDFSPYSYSFVDHPDLMLNSFDTNLTHDTEFGMTDVLVEAHKTLKARGGNLRVFGSPWSPPSWMKKENHTMVGSAQPCLKDDSRIHSSYAHYLSKWVDAYEAKSGVRIWGITAQNEPKFYNNTVWEACSYTAEEQRDFIRDHLGPLFRKKFGHDKVILHFDWNKETVADWANVVLGDAEAAKFIWGTALHWYDGDHFDQVAQVYNQFGKKHHMLATEGCTCGYDLEYYPTPWKRAARYVHDMIGDLNNGVEGWVDWNLLLNIKEGEGGRGGPNHAGNFCFSHIHVDENGRLIVHPSYYAFGHVSRFLPPGSRIIDTNFRDAPKAGIEALAARRDGGSIVAVLLNDSPAIKDVFLTIKGAAKGLNFRMDPNSVATVEIPPEDVFFTFAIGIRVCGPSVPGMRYVAMLAYFRHFQSDSMFCASMKPTRRF